MDYKILLEDSIGKIESHIGGEYTPKLEDCLRPPLKKAYDSGWSYDEEIECLNCGSQKNSTLRCVAWEDVADGKPHFCVNCLRKLITSIQLKFTVRTAQCSTCYKKGKIQFVRFEHGDTRIQFCMSCFIHPDELDPYKELRAIAKKVRENISEIETQEIKTKKIQGNMQELYQSQGLTESFARSIAEGNNPDEVMDLWDMDWWKQYPEDDLIVTKVLKGEMTASQAEYLNSIRSDHGEAVSEVLQGLITFDWLKALMDSGYLEHPTAVEPILKGADPVVIARIHKIEINEEALPPAINI